MQNLKQLYLNWGSSVLFIREVQVSICFCSVQLCYYLYALNPLG